jgi:hypothetical protein
MKKAFVRSLLLIEFENYDFLEVRLPDGEWFNHTALYRSMKRRWEMSKSCSWKRSYSRRDFP